MPTARITLASDIESRTASTAKDARLVNAIVEGDPQEKRIVKRPGLQALNISPAMPAGQGQGLYSWNDYLIVGVSNNIYLITGQTTSNLLGSAQGTQLPLSFATVANDTKLAFHNGANLYTINAGTNGGLPTFVGGVGLSGVINSVQVTNGGGYYGYATSCTVTVGATTTINATAHGLVVGQGVTFTGTLPTGMSVGTTYQVATSAANSFTINTATDAGGAGSAVSTSGSSSGVSFLASPTVTFSASPGVTAVGVAYLFNHQVAGVILTTHGSGYTSTPTITFSAPVAGVVASANMSTATALNYAGGAYMTLNTPPVLAAGSGYLQAPVITFGGSSYGINATGYTTINSAGQVTGIVLTSGGQYKENPGVLLSPGNYPNNGNYAIDIATATIANPSTVTATATAVMSSSGITGPFAAGLAYLDNTCYVMTIDGKVWNSNPNDPATWTPNYLQASSDPDGGVGLFRHLNYLVAFGQWSTEFFYDAGNPTGSPLAVNQSAKLEIGCANGYSIAQADQTILWVGQSQTEGRAVFLMDGLSPVKISTKYIEKYLNAASMTNMVLGGQTVSSVRSYCFKISGHTLYVLTLADLNYTFVYDLDEKKWYQWTSQTGDTGTPNSGTEGYFSPTAFNGNIEYQAGLFLQDDDTGLIYKMDSSYTSDNGAKIYVRAVTPILDSGTTKTKFYKRVEVVGDKVGATGYIRRVDDDYVTFSNYRSVDLSITRPILWQYGSARRRAWEFFHSDNTTLRIDAIEIDFEIGEQGNE